VGRIKAIINIIAFWQFAYQNIATRTREDIDEEKPGTTWAFLFDIALENVSSLE
jgi:hypothetical protein